jgi:glycerol-3-phosphate acyltransferase PlsY
MNYVIAVVLGYLLGSIPFGLLLTRSAGIDIRKIGSGNFGATNVLRTGNRWMALATLLLDAGKGAAAVLIARYFLNGGETELSAHFVFYAAGLAAFLGHLFPVWLGFKGGKGVATYIGVMLACHWIVGLIFCAVWLLIAVARRYSSLSALTAAAVTPIFAYIFEGMDSIGTAFAAMAAIMSILVYYKHWQNIQRLIAGTEPKIGQKTAG